MSALSLSTPGHLKSKKTAMCRSLKGPQQIPDLLAPFSDFSEPFKKIMSLKPPTLRCFVTQPELIKTSVHLSNTGNVQMAPDETYNTLPCLH